MILQVNKVLIALIIQNLKPQTTVFLEGKEFNELSATDKELMDGILSHRTY